VTKVPDDVLLDLRERARYFSELTDVGVPRAALARPVAAAAAPAPPSPRPPAAPVLSPEGAELRDLPAVREWVGDCRRCKLAGGRKTIVFGQGNPQARLMFVGEAPGADEDEQGLAFVGRAGQLLTDIIEKGLKMPRADVFIANVLKCRPPGNRDPLPDEIEACTPWLVEQVSLIQPRLVVTLGNFATKYVLQTARGITSMRGAVYPWHGRSVVPTYHPAAILHGGGEKGRQFQELRDDFALISETLARLQGAASASPVIPATPAPPASPSPSPVVVPDTLEPDPNQLELF
jgi:uracil-DNA glycosylase